MLAIASKEIIQLRRDRLTIGMIIGIPTLQLLLFGYAINTDIRDLSAAVADQAQTRRSRDLVAATVASQVVEVVAEVATPEELEALLRAGRISVGIHIPPDFERRLTSADRPTAHLLVDASDPTLLAAAKGLLSLPITDELRSAPVTRPPPTFELRAFYNPERRSEVQIVPALIGVILTLTMSLFTAVAIVRERERGTLELLITTPVRRNELMIGKILPYVIIGLIQVSLILTLGFFLFHVPVRGSIIDLYLASVIFIASTLTLGLLVSTIATSQFQSFQMIMFFFLPSILLSGFMFPFEGMPKPAQWLAELLPLTHFVRLVRAIVLRGATLPEIGHEIWPLVAFFVVTLVAAMLRFRKRLD
ncbi:MAG: ABC transporter permease [bacterium]|nr:ABC transporter permease [bacterium]